MPLSWNEIRNRAHEFSKRWENEISEDAEAKPFWIEFLNVFGIDRKRVASFEEPVKKLGDKQGYIDMFWKGMLLVEHKSRGKDLDKAFTQALDYFPGIKERDLPKYVLVSDFARFRLYDLEAPSPPAPLPQAGEGSKFSSPHDVGRGGSVAEGEGRFYEFKLADLHKRIKHFAFIAGYRTQTIAPQNPAAPSPALTGTLPRAVGGNQTPLSLDGRGAGEMVKAAFVSTNSITQGEQAGVLWGWLLAQGIHIHFAHRTFQWSNEAKGMAAVHCVIIGFGAFDAEKKTIYEYEDIRGEPHAVAARNINPYLVDAPDVVLVNRQYPICAVPEIGIGNKPIDGGHYLFTPEEKAEFLAREPKAAKWFRRWIGADEFINNYERWCLWLGDCPPDELRRMPEAMKRVEAVRVREVRLASKSVPTQKLAATPTRFHVENIPDAPYLVIPEVSSERRTFIPIGFMQPDTLSSNLVKIIPHATLYHFGILTSTMHIAWVRYTCGRLESRYRYSAGIVYNNFPWPASPSDGTTSHSTKPASGQVAGYPQPSPVKGEGAAPLSPRGRGAGGEGAVEAAAQAVLDARAQYMFPSPASGITSDLAAVVMQPSRMARSSIRGARGEGDRVSAANSASLADLYDPLTMPPALVKAHQALDRAVDACYRKAAFASDAQRVEFLFERYQQLTSLLPTETGKSKRKK